MYAEIKKKLDYILKRYHKYKKLTNYILWDYKIDLKPKTSLKFFPIYKLTKIKKQALKEFV